MSRSGETPTAAEVRVPDRLFFRIRDVAKLVGVEPYVLRYWETEFPSIAPNKSAAGHRVYRRSDVETILLIKKLLYVERYSIEGARKRLVELKRGGKGDEPALSASLLTSAAAEAEARAIALTAPATLADIREAARKLSSLVRETQVSDLFAWGS